MPVAKLRTSGTAIDEEDVTFGPEARMSPPAGNISDADWRTLQHEVARYIASLTTELAAMARSSKFDLLVYFLEMAQVEATAQAERTEP